MHLVPLDWTVKHGKVTPFMLCDFYHNKKKHLTKETNVKNVINQRDPKTGSLSNFCSPEQKIVKINKQIKH